MALGDTTVGSTPTSKASPGAASPALRFPTCGSKVVVAAAPAERAGEVASTTPAIASGDGISKATHPVAMRAEAPRYPRAILVDLDGAAAGTGTLSPRRPPPGRAGEGVAVGG